MCDSDPNEAQDVPEDRTPPPAPVAPPAPVEPTEPRWMLMAGIIVFCGLLVLTWWRNNERLGGTESFSSAISARSRTYLVEGRYYLHLRGNLPHGLEGLGDPAALRNDARDAAGEWKELAQQESDQPDSGFHWMDAAGLFALANDPAAARQALIAARKVNPARAAVYTDLLPLVGNTAGPLSPAASAAVTRTSVGSVWLARAALTAHHPAAARDILEPAARAAVRVLGVNGGIALLGLLIVAAALVLSLVYQTQINATFAHLDTPTPATPWGIGLALTMIGALFLGQSLLTELVVGAFKLTSSLHVIAVGVGAEILLAVLLVGLFGALYGRHAWDLTVVGWRRVRGGAQYGLLTLIITLPLVWLAALLSASLFHEHDGTHPIIPFLFSARSIWVLLGLAFMALVMAPVIEETFFRGILFPALGAQLPFWQAALVSGILFSAIHGQLAALLPIAVLGVAFAFLMRRTQTLWASATAHAAFNALSTLIALLTSWALHGPGS